MKRLLATLFGSAGLALAFFLLAPGHAAAATADIKTIQDSTYLDGPVIVDGITFNNNGATPYSMSFDWTAALASTPITGTCHGDVSFNSYTGHVLDTPWYYGVDYPFSSGDGNVHQTANFNINLPAVNSGAYQGQGLRVGYRITCRSNLGVQASDVVYYIYTSLRSRPKIDNLTLNNKPGDVDASVKIPHSGEYNGALTLAWSVRQASFCAPYIAESTPDQGVLQGWGWQYPESNGDPTQQTSSTFSIRVPANALPYGTAAIVNYGFACFNTDGRSFTRYVVVHLSRLADNQDVGCGTQITDVSFVLDGSSSMNDLLQDGRTKKQASAQSILDFQNFIRQRSLPVRYSFVDFSGGAEFTQVKFPGITQTAPYGVYIPPDKAGGPSTNPDSGTCIACAISAIQSTYAQQYRTANKVTNPKIVVLLTDGKVSVVWDGVRWPQFFGDPGYGIPQNQVVPDGPHTLPNAENQVIQFAQNQVQSYPNVVYFTVGLGTPGQVDQPFLRQIARITHPANDDNSFVGQSYIALSNFYLNRLPQAIQQSDPVQISGTLFEDINRNSVWDQGEPVIDGTSPPRTVTVASTSNESNRVDIPVGVNGKYSTIRACPDEYKISQSLPAGWDQTLPVGDPGYYQEYVSSDIVRDFGSARKIPPVVSGTVYIDLNGNSVQDAGEAGIQGQTIELEKADGTPTGTQVVTDANGAYTLTFSQSLVWTDPYILQQSPPPDGYVYSNPVTGAYPATVYPPGTTTRNFADAPIVVNSSVTGTVFDDTNADGIQGGNEVGVAGVQIALLDANNVIVAQAVTDTQGVYHIQISGRNVGELYTLKSGLPANYTFTVPADGQYTNLLLDPGMHLIKDFGMKGSGGSSGSYGPFCS